MPELPEVEVLVRHLRPLLRGRIVEDIAVTRAKVVAPHSPGQFAQALRKMTFREVRRRGKYLLFDLAGNGAGAPLVLVGHLGMTGRMYLAPAGRELPRHCPVIFRLGGGTRAGELFVFEDTRYFGRMTLQADRVARLGPEPLEPGWTAARFKESLRRSAQPIKTKLLDQRIVAGIGNIYASEALFRARILPGRKARSLSSGEVGRLWRSIRAVLREAISFGSTVPLDIAGEGDRDGLFYYGRPSGERQLYEERLRVYGREGEPCPRCGSGIRRIVQGGRSTFFCPSCQKS